MKPYITIILIALSALLLSCSPTDSNTTMYDLTTSVEPLDGGTVNPSQGEYEEGETVQLTATPNEHWVFDRWEGDYSGTSSSVNILMDGDKEISALFIKREYPLTVDIEGEGTVTEMIVQQKTTDYEGGTTVELTAAAGEGWHFVRWEGDAEGSENPVTIEITGEKTVTAVFEKTDYALTVNVIGEGTVTEEVVQAKAKDYPYQTIVELTANPSEGWVFSGWEGNLTGSDNPAQITIENDAEVTAIFVRQYYTITITYDGPGMTYYDLVSGNQSDEGFEYESVVSIRVQPLEDWEFLGWQGDLTGTANPIEVTVTGNITAHAILEQVPFDGEGTINNPYQIATLEQLNAIRGRYLDDHFVQVADIDASETSTWNNGEGFIPIGLINTKEFKGTYDGGGFHIDGLTINLSSQYYYTSISVGLFGIVKYGQVKNLALTNIDVTGFDHALGIGGVAGLVTTGSRIENVHVSGRVSGINYVGGLVGILEYGEVNLSVADVAVEGNSDIGGLIGASTEGRINLSRADGTVTGNQNVGGLIGAQREAKMVSYSSATGNVTGNKNVGGLIGSSTNTKEAVIRSYATGDVFGAENVGGLIGFFSGYSSVGETYATGTVSSNQGSVMGGLIGILAMDSRIYKSYALGEVSGKDTIGGLIGSNSGQIYESFSAGMVTGSTSVGGLAGFNKGVLTTSYWDMETSGHNSPAVWDPYQEGVVTEATGLTTSQMTGANAQVNMPDFDWVSTWNTTSGYPALKANTTSGKIQ